MKIQTLDREIGDLLSSGFFRIPRFQRPYSWQTGEVEDFWNDTIVEPESDYFIGAIVLYNWTKGLYGVVDGQQRLATIAMTLCALRNSLKEAGFMELADGVHGLIERRDIDNTLHFVIQTESSYPYLQEHILKNGPSDETPVITGTEEQRLQKAFAFLSDKVKGAVDAVQTDTTLSADKRKTKIRATLLGIRDRLLSLKVISTTLESEDDAYTIFETLNTKGMDLTITDLVRTLITRLLPNQNRGLDRPKDRFNEVVKLLETSVAEISPSTFLHHYWLSRHEYIAEKRLYKAVKKVVRTKKDAKDFLDTLESDAKCYRYVHEPTYRSKWQLEEIELRDSITALNLFRVRQQVPFVLAVMRGYERKAINVKLARRALSAVEHFHFVFTAVTSQRSSGGISSMYALHARQLQRADTVQDRTKAVDELIQKLSQKLPPYDEFVANFRLLQFSEKYTKRKELVKYVLRHFAKQNLGGVPPDWGAMTIEHLADQSKSQNTTLTDEEVAEIGNLMLVSEDLNKRLSTKPFGEKVRLLKDCKMADECILRESTWGAAGIRRRTDFMADLAFTQIWKI